MSLKSKSGLNNTPEQPFIPRWQRILNLPEGTYMKDISTGLKYTVGQFTPIYTDGYKNVVETFKIKGTEEYVSVRHLRLLGDDFYCSLMVRDKVA